MKTWLKEIWEFLIEPWVSPLVMMVLAILMGLLLNFNFYLGGWAEEKETAVWQSLVLEPEPEVCALCEDGIWMNYHGPCLVSLSSGEIRELEVYQIQAGETTEESSGGYVHFFNFDGAWSSGNMVTHTCEVTLPEEMKRMDGVHFCRDCRAKLAEITTEGYVLADLYGAEHFALYPVTAGGGICHSGIYGDRHYRRKIRTLDCPCGRESVKRPFSLFIAV